MSETELCDLVRTEPSDSTRGPAAFAELYSRSYDLAMSNAYRFLGDHDRDRAEDVVSEAYANTLRALHGGLGPSDSFMAYLMTAVRSEVFRVSPAERATIAVANEELEWLEQSVEPDGAIGIAERDQLLRAFEALPAEWQRVLYLIDVADELPKDAAVSIGSSLRATNSLLFRAREALRASYLQQYVERAQPQCAGVVPTLGRFVRGGLREQKKAAVAGHIEGCPTCSAQIESLRRINENLRTWVGPAAAGLGAAGAAVIGSGGATGAAALSGAGAAGSSATVAAKSSVAVKWWAGAASVGAAATVLAVVLWPRPEVPVPEKPAPQVEVVAPTPTPDPVPIPEPEPEPEPPVVDPEPPAPEPPAPVEDDESPNWVEVE